MTSTADPERLHRLLAASHSGRLNPSTEVGDWERALQREFDIRLVEHRFVEAERKEVAAAVANVPRDPARFVSWFESIEQTGPGQHDPLFLWPGTPRFWRPWCKKRPRRRAASRRARYFACALGHAVFSATSESSGDPSISRPSRRGYGLLRNRAVTHVPQRGISRHASQLYVTNLSGARRSAGAGLTHGRQSISCQRGARSR